MNRISQFFIAGIVLATAGIGMSQNVTPDKVSFNAETVRALLPPDGKLVEQGQVGKNYVGFVFGNELKANGQKINVGSKLESKGVDFGDGYIALNIGSHVEIEPLGGKGPTLAFNATARIFLTVEDEFKVKLRVDDDHLKIEGDNLGGKAAVAAKKEDIKELIRAEVAKQGDKFTQKLRELKTHPELKFVVIHPAGIDVVKMKPVRVPTKDTIVSAKLHFHTTTDDKEGGTVKVEFYSDENTKFAEVPTLPEENWKDKSRKEVEHKFTDPIPLPEKMAFAKISLTEAREINIGWNFEATITLKTASGKEIVFEGTNLRLDTTGGKKPATKSLKIPKVR